MIFLPGNKFYTPDTLSGSPVSDRTTQIDEITQEVELYADMIVRSLPAIDQRLQELRELY
jgi:hypothetical protein